MDSTPEYQELDLFKDDFKDMLKSHCNPSTDLERSIETNLRLIKSMRYEKNSSVLTPKGFGKAPGFGIYPVYWTKMALIGSGLKSKAQMPKCYVYMSDKNIVYLCAGSHIENYKDSELRKLAQKRLNYVLSQLGEDC